MWTNIHATSEIRTRDSSFQEVQNSMHTFLYAFVLRTYFAISPCSTSNSTRRYGSPKCGIFRNKYYGREWKRIIAFRLLEDKGRVTG
jgi:hypothetical protein